MEAKYEELKKEVNNFRKYKKETASGQKKEQTQMSPEEVWTRRVTTFKRVSYLLFGDQNFSFSFLKYFSLLPVYSKFHTLIFSCHAFLI